MTLLGPLGKQGALHPYRINGNLQTLQTLRSVLVFHRYIGAEVISSKKLKGLFFVGLVAPMDLTPLVQVFQEVHLIGREHLNVYMAVLDTQGLADSLAEPFGV